MTTVTAHAAKTTGIAPRPTADLPQPVFLQVHLGPELAAATGELQAPMSLFAQAILLLGLAQQTQEVQSRWVIEQLL